MNPRLAGVTPSISSPLKAFLQCGHDVVLLGHTSHASNTARPTRRTRRLSVERSAEKPYKQGMNAAAPERSAEPIVRLEGVRKSFGDNLVLDGIDVTVAPGEVLTIIGPSGSG